MDKLKASGLIRWGIIGCGNVTELKSGPAYKLTQGFELKAVMRRDLNLLKDYAQRHQIEKYYTQADALINDPEIDAVYIATPPDSHLYYALKVADAGKPCCIEKPLTPSYAESLKIYETFRDKNIPLFTAYYRRSLPRFEQINTWLKEHKIGEIRTINWQFCKPPSATDLSETYNWRTDVEIAPGGYFDDLASHGLDLFTHLLGNIKDVFGISLNQQNIYDAKDAIVACWVHENGVTGSGNWNFGSGTNEDIVEIKGSKGKITFAVFNEISIILETEEENIELFIDHPKHIQMPHVENMKKHLLEENYTHPSSGLSGLHTSWVMDKILGNIT
jgi:1,5-anhydro-D-fructose reductase (1,5-anhydro-D-mannitol-forming)